MKILSIGGWGILPASGLAHVKARFHKATHEWCPPSPNALADYESFDGLAGYYLRVMWAGLDPCALLLARFDDFKKESGLSGSFFDSTPLCSSLAGTRPHGCPE
jgi:hypothetical protein